MAPSLRSRVADLRYWLDERREPIEDMPTGAVLMRLNHTMGVIGVPTPPPPLRPPVPEVRKVSTRKPRKERPID